MDIININNIHYLFQFTDLYNIILEYIEDITIKKNT